MNISISELKVGDVVEIAPPVGNTVTAWSRQNMKENIGDLNKGEVYKVHKIDIDTDMVELEEDLVPWPENLHPVSWGGVWVRRRSLQKPGAPKPEPVGLTKFERAALAAAKRFVEVMEGSQ